MVGRKGWERMRLQILRLGAQVNLFIDQKEQACTFPDRILDWLKKTIEEITKTKNNRSYGIREQIKIQVWKRYRITHGFISYPL